MLKETPATPEPRKAPTELPVYLQPSGGINAPDPEPIDIQPMSDPDVFRLIEATRKLRA